MGQEKREGLSSGGAEGWAEAGVGWISVLRMPLGPAPSGEKPCSCEIAARFTPIQTYKMIREIPFS